MCQALGWVLGIQWGPDTALLYSIQACLTSSLPWGSSGAKGLKCLLGTLAYTV